jgi:tetratricopeptide (TPR) repeat protein
LRLLGALLVACVLMVGIVVWQLLPGGERERQATSDGRPQAHAPAPAHADAPAGVPTSQGRVATGGAPAVEQRAERRTRANPTSQHAGAASQPAVRWAADPQHRRAQQRLVAAREALAVDPSNPVALRDALAAARELGRWAEVRRMLARLVEAEPGNTEIRFEYAVTLMRLRRWVDAVHTLRFVVEQRPDHGHAWYNLAVACRALGHLDEARRAWDRAIELLPDNSDAYAQRGEVLLDLHEWSVAAADFEVVLEHTPDDIDSALNLSLALWKLGRLDEAQARVAGVVERHPRHVRALNRMAELCWAFYEIAPETNRAQREAAVAYWRRSLEVDRSQSAVEAALEAAVGRGRNP